MLRFIYYNHITHTHQSRSSKSSHHISHIVYFVNVIWHHDLGSVSGSPLKGTDLNDTITELKCWYMYCGGWTGGCWAGCGFCWWLLDRRGQTAAAQVAAGQAAAALVVLEEQLMAAVDSFADTMSFNLIH